MPPAVAGRPRDARGYPVPAITPWTDGAPQFGATGVARTFLCAIERRCSICAGVMAPGPVWRVVGDAEAAAIASAGPAFRNAAPTAEAPGHRDCMRYAAAVCPWLARPNARRGRDVSVAGHVAARGEPRGAAGAVVGFRTYDFSFSSEQGVLFRFDAVVEFLPHEIGTEHSPQVSPGVASTSDDPPYLSDDEEAAERAFAAYLNRLG